VDRKERRDYVIYDRTT